MRYQNQPQPTIESIIQKQSFNNSIKNIPTDKRKLILNFQSKYSRLLDVNTTGLTYREMYYNSGSQENHQIHNKDRWKPPLPQNIQKSFNSSKQVPKRQKKQRITISHKQSRNIKYNKHPETEYIRGHFDSASIPKPQTKLQFRKTNFESLQPLEGRKDKSLEQKKIKKMNIFQLELPIKSSTHFKIKRQMTTELNQQKQQTIQTKNDQIIFKKTKPRFNTTIPEFIKVTLKEKQSMSKKHQQPQNNQVNNNHFQFDDRIVDRNPQMEYKKKNIKKKRKSDSVIRNEYISDANLNVQKLRLKQKEKIDPIIKFNSREKVAQNIIDTKVKKVIRRNDFDNDINLCGWEMKQYPIDHYNNI